MATCNAILILRTATLSFILFSPASVFTLPRQSNYVLGTHEAIRRLYRYGYINPPNQESPGNPIPDRRHILPVSEDRNAMQNPSSVFYAGVKAFQIYFQLPVTGRLDLETRSLLASPRCGNPDEEVTTATHHEGSNLLSWKPRGLIRQKRYLIGEDKMHWAKKKITWRIETYPSHHLNRSQTHAVFQHAFNLWTRVADLDFKEEKDYYKDADIIIKFGSKRHGDSISFDGPGGVLAHAFYPMPEPIYSFSGDAHFDDDETWSDVPHNEHRNLLSVATHELGHSMGLGHSSVATSVMYPYYLTRWSRVELDKDDIDGMQKIYGAPKPGKVIPPEPVLPDIPPPPSTTTSPDLAKTFNYCNISIDAIIEVRGLELYIFKDELQWRVTWSKTVSSWISYQLRDTPTKIVYYWNALPSYVDYIDAAIERDDSLIYIFRGNRFWLLSDNKHLATDVPRSGLPLSHLGLPEDLVKIDAVFKWAVNGKIYVFAGDNYWCLNTDTKPYGKVTSSPDYPRKIFNTWRGVPTPVTAAYTTRNGVTLFFHGSEYYAFDNTVMKTRVGYPKPARLTIIGCSDI